MCSAVASSVSTKGPAVGVGFGEGSRVRSGKTSTLLQHSPQPLYSSTVVSASHFMAASTWEERDSGMSKFPYVMYVNQQPFRNLGGHQLVTRTGLLIPK